MDIIPTDARPLAPLDIDTAELVRLFLAGRSPRTLRAYGKDLEAFAAWSGVESVADATSNLIRRPLGEANALAIAYRSDMIDSGLAPATINRRLASLRSLVKLARTLGLVGWTLEVESVPSMKYRDTRGCGVEGYRKALGAIPDTDKGKRNRAMLRLMFDMGLRRGELVGIDLADYDAGAGRLWITGKGRREREALTVPAPTADAIAAWIVARGDADGPLFTNLDRRTKGGRLSGASVYRIVAEIGKRAGIVLRPHGLRHAGITAAMDDGADMREAAKFSRHRDIRTLQAYDDNRSDIAGRVASRVASLA